MYAPVHRARHECGVGSQAEAMCHGPSPRVATLRATFPSGSVMQVILQCSGLLVKMSCINVHHNFAKARPAQWFAVPASTASRVPVTYRPSSEARHTAAPLMSRASTRSTGRMGRVHPDGMSPGLVGQRLSDADDPERGGHVSREERQSDLLRAPWRRTPHARQHAGHVRGCAIDRRPCAGATGWPTLR